MLWLNKKEGNWQKGHPFLLEYYILEIKNTCGIICLDKTKQLSFILFQFCLTKLRTFTFKGI